MRIIIKFSTFQIKASLFDTPTGRTIFDALPFECNVSTWGDEIYFGIPVQCILEPDADAKVSVGDLAYWPSMPAFCIFFGPTPVSHDHPVAASPVNVFGKLDPGNFQALRSIKDGESVIVEKYNTD